MLSWVVRVEVDAAFETPFIVVIIYYDKYKSIDLGP